MFVRSFIRSFVYSFICSFVCSLVPFFLFPSSFVFFFLMHNCYFVINVYDFISGPASLSSL